ncbi:MAG: lipoyl synthase [Desulfobacterales bacterium]|nr:lipoyl synthase [Desulfobacterales bacterium]
MKDAQPPKRDAPRKPPWLKRRLPTGPVYGTVCHTLGTRRLHTVCQEAQCPNQWECFSNKTATFLILGARCTRRCRFCAVAHGPQGPPDPDEPARLAEAAAEMGLEYVVVTSVTRDDLPDGGAGIFAATIRAIRQRLPKASVEVLIPDFQGSMASLDTVLDARPDVLNHNLETVPRLYATVRPEADYRRSLALLQASRVRAPSIPTKSGLMLGLGETDDEIRQSLADLAAADCRMVTLGQYLQPSPDHLPVATFVTPEAFEGWRREALALGFDQAACGPLVRSSYQARELFHTLPA